MAKESTESCTWCGRAIEPGDGWRAEEIPGARRAAFCRLEHIVPWAIQGARWEAGELEEPSGLADDLEACAHCGAVLGDVHVVLVRHRGEHRIPDAFCSADHMADWAKSGGRWG
ncbi:MAG TPA: hypothetical protein VNC17_14655 [Thermoleophilaceae bacterium]|jgi:hypothetical protein|nr:hypothetical protein [Thermoleophilaceae bacterium]